MIEMGVLPETRGPKALWEPGVNVRKFEIPK